MTDLQPGNDVLILADPRCPRLAGMHAIYQGTNEAGHASIQIGTVGATVPKACLRLAEQHLCADCGRTFWRVVGEEASRCKECQAKQEDEDAFDPAAVVTEGDIADWSNQERESGLDWDTGTSGAPRRKAGGVTPSESYRWRCTQCHFQSEVLGEFLCHPCKPHQLEQQRQAERAIKRFLLNDFLFCPVCGASRLKKLEVSRRVKKDLLVPSQRCLLCSTPFDQDWSFLNQFYCFLLGHQLVLQCPTPNCAGELHISCDDFRPEIEWNFVGRRPYPRLVREKVALRCRHCGVHSQAHHLLPANRVLILREVTIQLEFYERMALSQLAAGFPEDPRVSPEGWKAQEAIWAERLARLKQEAEQESERG